MSIEITTRVWEHSSHAANPLNAMLALADMANHDGYCWPSVGSLAQRLRCSERQIQRIIADLESSGELYIERGVGRKNVSRYLITINTTVDQMSQQLVRYFGSPPTAAIETATRHIQKGDIWREKASQTSPLTDSKKGDICVKKVTSRVKKVTSSAKKGDTAMSPDPSLEPPLDPSVNDNDNTRANPLASSSSQPAPTAVLAQNQQPQPPVHVRLPAADIAAAVGERDPAYLAVKVAYENNIGLLTPILSQRIQEALRTYPPEWVPLAIERAVVAEKRRWDYVEGILRNWLTEGFTGPGSRRSRVQPPAEAAPDSYADLILH